MVEHRVNAEEVYTSERNKPVSRVERAFYTSIILSGLLLAIGTIFMQTRLSRVNNEMAEVNQEISAKQVEVNEAQQSLNELGSYSRLMKIAKKEKMTLNNDRIGVAE